MFKCIMIVHTNVLYTFDEVLIRIYTCIAVNNVNQCVGDCMLYVRGVHYEHLLEHMLVYNIVFGGSVSYAIEAFKLSNPC